MDRPLASITITINRGRLGHAERVIVSECYYPHTPDHYEYMIETDAERSRARDEVTMAFTDFMQRF